MKKLALLGLIPLSFAVCAQTLPPPQNVLQLSANGSIEAQQDLLSVSLTTTRESTDAAAVQSQLQSALDAALTEVRKSAQPGQMDVRTGTFSVYPRYSGPNKIVAWRGTAELVLEGRDFARITQAASRATTMTIGSIGFGLSREQRAKVEVDAQHMAIEHFKAKAADLARDFGFSGYTLREVNVTSNDFGQMPRYRMMAADSVAAAAPAPVPVEAGKATVTVTVSGSVQLR
ncbi:MAG TPA: SIMPL domain-containing protein [Ramlibacter sp.]|nr:SIMPL domain-containing protein [Ramlibacter sp.]